MGGRGSSSRAVRARTVALNAVRWAKSMIGSPLYGRFRFKDSIIMGVNKCNIFVADAFNKSNFGQPLEGTPNRGVLKFGVGTMRKFGAGELYDGRALKFDRVWRPRKGDICTDGKHVGIVSGKSMTISVSAYTGTVVENDWGFRGNSGRPQRGVRFYRYSGR